ncbi:MAG TPA: prolyl oligopeptidase family serine peptidase [Ginsengibacter sp.]|nr:prolyl oligopeptidase family serine peptidase [Ginsengibacter sp.]
MHRLILAAFFIFTTFSLSAQSAQKKAKTPAPMTWHDVSSWRFFSPFNVQFSADGNWVAYALVKTEGDGEIILKNIKTDSTRRYAIGGSTAPSMQFSENGKWFVFKEYPKYKEAKAAAKSPGKQLFEKLHLVDLSNFKQTDFDKAGRFSFNGKAETCLGIVLTAERPGGGAQATAGTNLLLYELDNGKKLSISKIGEFDFNKKGDVLAYTIQGANPIENGLFTMTLSDKKITVLDNDTATYKALRWTDDKEALAVLKMTKDKNYKDDKGRVLGVKYQGGAPVIYSYNPETDSLNFPKGMTISPNSTPYWSDNLTTLFFGINPLEPVKKEAPQTESKNDTSREASITKLNKIKADTSIHTLEDLKKALARAEETTAKKPSKNEADKPDMVIWNWQDKRLQSVQQVRERMDKNYSFSAMYNVETGKFHRLNDSSMMSVNIFPKQLYALGTSDNDYLLDESLDGQKYADLYIINLNTGEKSLFKEKFYATPFTLRPSPSPDGKKMVYGYDGNYYVYDLATQKEQDVTTKVPTSFINTEDDHNVTKPLTPVIGWSSDSKYILITDLWDIWQVNADGSGGINLTQNGATDKLKYQRRYNVYPDDKGIDLQKPQFFSVYGEWTKKGGVVRLNPAKNGLKPGVVRLLWDDAAFSVFNRSKHSDSYYFTKEDFNKSPEFYVADQKFSGIKQVTQNTPDANKYTFSAGTRLVNYVTDKGDSLQGVIYLPAGYQEGKKYPTIVYYYEKTSDRMHYYVNPSFPGGGYNAAMYTSNGYAVFTPDIVYKLDDPGMSAVWAVIPAVKAAIATGIVDPDRMGLQGHSWGGYQTAFLSTQTNMFKAAAPGAALTDMVSMYSLIYWNSGGGNMSIFEASQGRFRGAPWENWDSYLRNSPIYYVKNVQTPILMLHNDKDGAVDFTQGVEFYNALRRLKKPVVMIQYKGENHGIAKLENKKDCAVRMMEFFDHFLKGAPAPDWWSKGIDRLKMEAHLEERAF